MSIKRGFFLGKFMPPHQGHMLICRTALALVDELTVMLCSLPGDPIPGDLRLRWLRELLPQARVVHHNQPIPQEPAEHPQFWDIWRRAIQAVHPEPIDEVYGSDQYIHQLAETMRAEAVLIDPNREAVPTSASAIRAHPSSQWRYIPGVVRPHFVKRVCLFGPESTGKTTLARMLAAHYGATFMPEYGRIFDEQYQPEQWCPEHLVRIAKRHEAIRTALLHSARPLVFEDTDALLTIIWSRALVGEVDPWFEREFALADLYLLTDVDVPWVQDEQGSRQFGSDDMRRQFFRECKEVLDSRGANYQLLHGDWASREQTALAAVDHLLGQL